jgi:hypothetical protein
MAHLKLALIVVAASLGVLVPLTPAAQAPDLAVVTLHGVPCGPTGSATSNPGKALNRLKNRFRIPEDDQIDPTISLPAMLAPGNDLNRFNRFDPSKAATIQGFVIRAMAGGHGESCNCKATAIDEIDTHIELGLAADAPPTQRVIVEVTPRLRMLMKDKGIDWRTPTLQATFQGKWVEVTGWLMFDTAHIKQAENTNPGNPSNFRATCWELHPISSIKVLDAPAEAAAFQPKSFHAVQQVHAAHFGRSPSAKETLRKMHEEALQGFSAEERKEFEEEARERAEKKP